MGGQGSHKPYIYKIRTEFVTQKLYPVSPPPRVPQRGRARWLGMQPATGVKARTAGATSPVRLNRISGTKCPAPRPGRDAPRASAMVRPEERYHRACQCGWSESGTRSRSTGIRAHHHWTHRPTKPGFWSGKMGGMEKNGGGGMGKKLRRLGTNGEIAGIAHGLWRVVAENGTKMGEKMREKMRENGRKMGQNTHFSQSHFPPLFQRSKICLTVPFVKSSSPHLPTKKWKFLPLTNTHRHGG